MTQGDQNKTTNRSASWPLVVLVVIIIGVAGFVLLQTADAAGQRTLGEAMLTAALVAGPFLIAEVLLNNNDGRRDHAVPMPRSGDLAGQQLTDIDLSDRYLRRRSFASARLSDSDFSRADLSEATFDDARLTHAKLVDANLLGASLKSASCYQADFTNAILTNADLRWANLKHANLHQATLIDADLQNADIRGADLTNADLRGVNFQGARYSDTTCFPDNMADEETFLRLGLCRHPDEITVDEPATGAPRYIGVKSLVRSAAVVGAAAVVVAGIQIALPNRVDVPAPGARTARVSGVVLERPYYRISGTAQNVSVLYRETADSHVTKVFEQLPATIVVGPFTTATPLDIAVESLDGGTVRCEIYVGGDVVSQAGSAGMGGIASCAIS